MHHFYECGVVPVISQQNRFPLAYVQFVQILVDTFVLCSPLALYVDLKEYSVIAVGLVVFFFSGLNLLAKIFLGKPIIFHDRCLVKRKLLTILSRH